MGAVLRYVYFILKPRLTENIGRIRCEENKKFSLHNTLPPGVTI